MVVASLWMVFAPTAYAATVDELNSQINQNQAAANALHGKANTLAGQLAVLNAEAATLSAQIQANRAKSAELTVSIAKAQEDLATKKAILAESIRSIYQQSQISPLEMLASSKNFSEYVDKQQYSDQIKDHVQEAADAVVALQAKLNQEQADLTKALADQQVQQNVLASNQAQQAELLQQTRGEEAGYQSLVASQVAQRDQIQAAQLAAARRLLSGGATSGSTGSFTFKNLSGLSGCGAGGYNLCYDGVDSWQLYTKQCVSYTAWKEASQGRTVPRFNGRGNAYEWPGYLAGLGYRVDSSPEVGAVAIAGRSGDMPYGHAMYVEQVYGNGWVRVSQYNFGYPGEMYSTMDVLASGVTFIHF